MSEEPLIGVVVLAQQPTLMQLVGVTIVIVAGPRRSVAGAA